MEQWAEPIEEAMRVEEEILMRKGKLITKQVEYNTGPRTEQEISTAIKTYMKKR